MDYSVVITSYNSMDTIEMVIKGVCKLEPAPNQILIIDDASTDESTKIIRGLISGLPTFQLVENSVNLGQSYSRNQGVKMSKNEIVIFQDDDDISLPIRPAVHIESFSKGADFSYVSSLKSYPNGYKVSNINTNYSSNKTSTLSIVKHLSIGAELPAQVQIFAPSSTLAVRKSVFLKLNGFLVELRRLEDIELACRALVNHYVLSWSNPVCVERLHTHGSDKSSTANFLGEHQVLDSVRNLLTPREYFIAKKMAALREAYFSRSLFKLIGFLPIVIMLIIISPRKFFSIVRRILHDLRQIL